MTNDDLVEFSKLYNQTMAMYNKKVDDSTIEFVFELFEEYSLEEVRYGFKQASKKNTLLLTPAMVVDEIKLLRNEDDRSLEAEANQFFDQIWEGLRDYKDYVCDNPRAVVAFKKAFTTLEAFMRKEFDEEPFARKEFVAMYIHSNNVDTHNPDNYLIEGVHHYRNPIVEYIGNEERCQKIAVAYRQKKNLPMQISLTDKQIKQQFADMKQQQLIDYQKDPDGIDYTDPKMEQKVLAWVKSLGVGTNA